MSGLSRDLTEAELLKPTDSKRPWTTYWVDLLCGGEWRPWFTYSTVKAAHEVRDHFKGIKRLDDYCLWPSDPVKDARVRTVTVGVEVES